ncbi:trace amine-associated receptor 5-like [Physella acuta]|uniref:trace amine-associated receptor 5-like n=1 Tax=Physella acuta TaxID=109671 RepID=UPI0027DACD6E|nr:trace amine-associated receptor 5-like [Physella acuta]
MNGTFCNLASGTLLEQSVMSQNKLVLVPLAVVCSVITAFTIVVNLMLIIALVRSRSQETRQAPGKHGITQMLMTSMAVSDFIFGVFLMPLGVVEITTNGVWDFGDGFCYTRILLNNLLCSVSIFHLNFLALDRILAVYKPLWYRLRTAKTGALMVSISWTVPIVSILFFEVVSLQHVSLQIFQEPEVVTVIIINFFIPLSISYILYVALIMKIVIYNLQTRNKNNNRQSQFSAHNDNAGAFNFEQPNNFNTNATNLSLVSLVNMPSHNSSISSLVTDQTNAQLGNVSINKKTRQRMFKALRTIGSLVVAYTVCWLPSWISPPIISVDHLPMWYVMFLCWMGYFNSAINPLLCCFNVSVRRAVKLFLHVKVC